MQVGRRARKTCASSEKEASEQGEQVRSGYGSFGRERRMRGMTVVCFAGKMVSVEGPFVPKAFSVPLSDTHTGTASPPSAPPPLKSARVPGSWFRRRRVHIAQRRLRYLRRIEKTTGKWRLLVRSLYGYTRTLLAREPRLLDFGPAFRVQPDGSLQPDEKTIARSQCIQNLRASYPHLVGPLEGEIYLAGFEQGVEWQSRMGTQR